MALIVFGVVGAFIYSSVETDPAPPQRASEVSLDVAESRTSLPGIVVADVAEYVAPSVVTISADVEGGFAETGQSVGTGVIITSDGVAGEAEEIVENRRGHWRVLGHGVPLNVSRNR